MVGVSVTDGVSVIVGVSVMVGDKVMVGMSVMVGVSEGVGEGGKYRYATGSPKRNSQPTNRNKSIPAANMRQPADIRCLRRR